MTKKLLLEYMTKQLLLEGMQNGGPPPRILFAFLFCLSWMRTRSLFQVMSRLWWSLAAWQADWILRFFTSICRWIWLTATTFL